MALSDLQLDFMGKRKIATLFSLILLIASIASLATNGLKFGLDFTGGTLIEIEYSEAPQLTDVRKQLEAAGYENAVVQNFGKANDVLIRMQSDKQGLGDEVLKALQGKTEVEIELRRTEYVGPQVGEELRERGGLGMLIALLVVMAYVAVRFQYKFSVGAVLALAHDVILVLGFFSIFQFDFDLTVLGAILAVIGYSLNDTIVVSDRIRENFRIVRTDSAMEIINQSLNETLGRTLMTSLTTLLVLIALYLFGGPSMAGFALALLVGVTVGTYSSVYVAGTLLMAQNISRTDMIPAEKPETEEGVIEGEEEYVPRPEDFR
ncbi:protein translocase subunit SecF [Litoribrevibacter albus]|uniref:Protein-export membrane protein SecF n=1 Tax=Litoribrevibacter albus TaxID=1473156 RepID=A0AA37W5C0_9GAMM|nr:protein translocase subunit SecF [Litoribrevibacter albus]GLQ31047.1 protein-export membrane protein SecF [Litoribrevibacter albus]